MEQGLQKTFLKSQESYYKNLADLLIDAGRLPEAQQVLAMLKEEEYYEFIRRDARTGDVRATVAGYNPMEAEWVAKYEQISQRVAAIGRELSELHRKKRRNRSAVDKDRITKLRANPEVATQAFNATLSELQAAFAAIRDRGSASSAERYAELKEKQLGTNLQGLVSGSWATGRCW